MSAVDVHLWMLAGAAAVATDDLRILSAGERARAQRVRSQPDAARFVATRLLLRRLLGERLGVDAAAVPLSEGPWGRPQLDPSARSEIAFSIAHSHDRSVVALCSGSAVGVDLEVVEGGLAWRELLGMTCSAAEIARFDGEDDRRGRLSFYRRWVAKEAALKCLGVGLRISPADVATFDDEQGHDGYVELWWPSGTGDGDVLAAVALASGSRIAEVVVQDDAGFGAASLHRRSLCFPRLDPLLNG